MASHIKSPHHWPKLSMHLRFLKIFCDVVDLGSFSRAAEANDVSQSNASQVVHQLEERLGVQLIDRSKRPFVLTPEGQAVSRRQPRDRPALRRPGARSPLAARSGRGAAHRGVDLLGRPGPHERLPARVPRRASAGRRAARIPASASRVRSGRQRPGRSWAS